MTLCIHKNIEHQVRAHFGDFGSVFLSHMFLVQSKFSLLHLPRCITSGERTNNESNKLLSNNMKQMRSLTLCTLVSLFSRSRELFGAPMSRSASNLKACNSTLRDQHKHGIIEAGGGKSSTPQRVRTRFL